MPGLYGQGPQQFTAGQGRLARPRFRFSGNVSVGYDDNVFQTPTNAQGTPDQNIPVQVTPQILPATQTVRDPSTGAVSTVMVPGQEATFRTETIPGTPAPERIGSFVTRTDLSWDIQFASRRTLFTFDLEGGVDYYWNRPGKKYEYNGRLSMVYLRKLTGRAQLTASVDASYQESEPDFSRVNAPTSNTRGAYLVYNAKADLSYRLTPRFSTVTSVSYNGLAYQEKEQQSGDFSETTFGTELRYLFSPRLTLLGELRYSSSFHKDQEELDANTFYLIAGGELALSRRFSATLRIGETIQTFSEGGDSASSPYVEATLRYLLARGTSVSWNARYGYEEASVADSRVEVLRSGLTLTQIFSPRLQASLALNFVRSTSTATSTGAVLPDDTTTDPLTGLPIASSAPPETEEVTTETVQDTLDATLSLQYTLSRRWSLSLNYSYTTLFADQESGDYYRQRIFLGAAYNF